MAQSSGPIAQGTTAERQLTDVLWRDAFGDESGVIADMDGTAYAISLGTGSDVASIGSNSQNSIAKVAGFSHRIPISSPEPITIPAAVGSTRTDLITLRYDPAFTGAPGPIRLTRVAGTSASIPVHDDAPPGVEDLPLWAVTRAVGQALSQATVKRMFPRIAPAMSLDADAPLPLNSPIGTVLRQGNSLYRRQLDSSLLPAWIRAVESSLLIPSMSSRPTGTARFVGMRITPENRPAASFVWNGSYWIQDGLLTGTLTTNGGGSIPAGAYVSCQQGTYVNPSGSGGVMEVTLPVAFSDAPIFFNMWAGDTSSGLAYVTPTTGSTASKIRGLARAGNGSNIVGGLMRVNWMAVGYNT